MKSVHKIYFLLILIFATACDKDQGRMEDFFMEFATVTTRLENTAFILDNYKTIIPKSTLNYVGDDGQRVIINFTPLKGDTVKVNSVTDIYTGEIKKVDNVDNIENDVVKVQSVWVSGGYLNVIVNVEFYDKPHTIGLLQDLQSPDINLYFTHSINDDSPGYYRKIYASFSLRSIVSEGNETTKFKFNINTSSGIKVYDFEI